MVYSCFRNRFEGVGRRAFPGPFEVLSLIVFQVQEPESVHPLPEGDVAGGRIIGMGTVAVHGQTVVDQQDGTVVARDREFPEPGFRNVQITLEDEAEMVLIRSTLDGRCREYTVVHDRRGGHLRRPQEGAPMIGKPATRLQGTGGYGR